MNGMLASACSLHNLPSFRACSQLLASLSSYQYTRKAWKKEVFDLFVDQTFFQTDEECIRSWMTIVDNLMSHDRQIFKDLISLCSSFKYLFSVFICYFLTFVIGFRCLICFVIVNLYCCLFLKVNAFAKAPPSASLGGTAEC